ncbi:MAG TPA: CHRD domain-containing protein [Paludibacter sp.]|nr:CHRD domain-containing protein [Paludibacter sp.]
MKTKLFFYTLLMLIVISFGSCKDNENDNIVTFTATLNGASEVPTNASAATGTANFTYDKTTYILKGTVTFTGITPTAGHIHKGAPGVSGGVIFPLTSASPLTSPINFTSSPLNEEQRADLMANMYYVNLHTAAFPNGEIRGQLIMK